MRIKVSLKNGAFKDKEFQKVQTYIDNEVLRKCDPYVPFRTGNLKRSGISGTVKGSGEIVYNAPYAEKQYYENEGKGKQGTNNKKSKAKKKLRGSYWFKRAMADHGQEILTGAIKLVKKWK